VTTPSGILFSDPRVKPLSTSGQFQAGAYLCFFITGTTTPTNVYSDGALATPLSQPTAGSVNPSAGTVAASDGRFVAIYLNPATVYRVQLYSAAGSLLADTDPYLVPGGPIFAITAGETAASVTPSNLSYPPGDLRRYGGVADSGTTNNTSPLQNALNANAGYFPVVVEATGTGYYGGIAGVVTVPAGTDLQLKGNAKLSWASTTALSGPTIGGTATRPGLSLTGGNVKISGQGSIVGPTASNTFVSQEVGIIVVGTSAASKFLNITIDGVEVTGWGQYAILAKWIQDLRITNNYVHDVGYGGIVPMSCTNVIVTGNEVGPIKPGASSNAYGMNFTYDTTTSNSRTDANHMCIGVECAYNFVHDIPLWLGIATHGTFDSRFHHNRVYNCWTGIQAAADGSGSFCGENNDVSYNVINLAQYNGSATTVAVANPIGITVNGNTTNHAGVTVIGNVIEGYGGTTFGSCFSLQAVDMTNPVIVGNIFRNWIGVGIYLAGTCIGGVIANNTFDAVQTTSVDDSCIYLDGNTTGALVTGNVHNVSTGTKAHFGLIQIEGQGGNPVAGLNDFSAAQTAQYGDSSTGSPAAASLFQTFAVPSAISVKGGMGFYGVAPGAQRASTSIQRTSNLATSTAFGTYQQSVVQEVMNTLALYGLWSIS
jgi:hypothetical protein